MLGMLCWQDRGRVRLERGQVAGMRVLCACVSRGKGEGRGLARAAKQLRRAGVCRVLELAGEGPRLPNLPAVDALPLYRAMADRLALEMLRVRGIRPERASVVLRGEFPDRDLVVAARTLCPQVRQVVVDTERGGAALQRSLLREFGVAVMPVKNTQDVLTIRFGGQDRGEELRLCGPVELNGLSVDAPWIELPDWLSRTSVLCALWQAGQLDLGQILVHRTT